MLFAAPALCNPHSPDGPRRTTDNGGPALRQRSAGSLPQEQLRRGRPNCASSCKGIDAATYAAFNRAVREAVRRINADKAAYLHYFIDYHKAKDPEIGMLQPQDIRASRVVVCDPAPIPFDEMRQTYAWLKSWDMLEETASPLELVNVDVQQRAHVAAE
jgi:hypothetical protein